MPYVSCSDHKAICFARTSPDKGLRTTQRITAAVYNHRDFRRQTILEYSRLLEEDIVESNPPRRLILLKRAMHLAAKCIAKEVQTSIAEKALDKIEWIMAFIRAAEKQSMGRMRQCAQACPDILKHCNPANPEARSSDGFQELKTLVVSLSRENITDEMEQLAAENDIQERAHRKENIVKKLKRLLPGNTNTLAAMQTTDGDVTDSPEGMAETLKLHWGKVFGHKEVDFNAMENWLSSLQRSNSNVLDTANTHNLYDITCSDPDGFDLRDKPLQRKRTPRGRISEN